MNVLLAGETGPGSLARSLLPGLRRGADVTLVDPSGIGDLVDTPGPIAAVLRRRRAAAADERLGEAVRDLRPDAVLIVKGRGLTEVGIASVRGGGTRVVVYYPDNPWWRGGDSRRAWERLRAADLVVVWSERLARKLGDAGVRSAVVPFGYDPEWFALRDPASERDGIAFLGTWSRRRERFLRALDGLPLVVYGTGWAAAGLGAPPRYESGAGEVLGRAAIGVNLLHPQCAAAHNMRTREICASGALQLTEPGTDGTPLRDGESAVWFRTPEELRALAERWLAAVDDERAAFARAGQDAVRDETYEARGRQLLELVAGGV